MAVKRHKQITDLMRKFLKETENGERREERLVAEIYDLAIHAKNENVRLSASSLILDRVDGKVAERKEVKNLKIQGIVHIPRVEDRSVIPVVPTPAIQYSAPIADHVVIPKPVTITKD